MAITKTSRRNKIRRGIRSKISGTKVKPRVSIFKSNKFIYAQVIDDLTGSTLASASSAEIDKSKNTNVDIANQVGKKLAEKAVSNGLSEVVFDRSGYLYHGKIKALAEGAREGGLKF